MWPIKESTHKASGQGAMKSMMECTMHSHWCICVWMYMTRNIICTPTFILGCMPSTGVHVCGFSRQGACVHQPSYLNACLHTGVRVCGCSRQGTCVRQPSYLNACLHTGVHVCGFSRQGACVHQPSYLNACLHTGVRVCGCSRQGTCVRQPSYLNACLHTGVRVWGCSRQGTCVRQPSYLNTCLHTGVYVCVHVHDNEHNMCKPSYLHASLHWCMFMCVHVRNKEHTVCMLTFSRMCNVGIYRTLCFNQNCHTKQFSVFFTADEGLHGRKVLCIDFVQLICYVGNCSKVTLYHKSM